MNNGITLRDLRSRLDEQTRRWSPDLRRTLLEYRQSADSARSRNWHPCCQPYWILLPSWLFASYTEGRGPAREDHEFLADALQGQYCLFLAFRIRDDIMDEHGTSPVLADAIDPLFRMAGSLFGKYFPPSDPFWRSYDDFVSGTDRAIMETDVLQCSPRTQLHVLKRCYPRVNSVFRTAATAVCLRYGRSHDAPVVGAFSDKFSTACQILDDLADIAEDSERGRWNYAARYVMDGVPAATIHAAADPHRLVRNLVSRGLGISLLGEVRTLVREAFSGLKPLGIPATDRCLRMYETSIDEMKLGLFAYALDVAAGEGRTVKKGGSTP